VISRRIPRSPEHDDYRYLARYIADAGHDGEKCLLHWCAGCWSGDDEYELAIGEVEATQALNVRTSREKTYHLMVSFRPEDEAKLTPNIFMAIESEFAKTLGFEEHQRHCGVHRNTDNLHLHIAYNQIHPERRTRHEPYFDYLKRDKLCRALEQKYGLTVDNGRAPEKESAVNDAARDYEAHTGQESFFSYAQRHKSDILAALGQATDWVAAHKVFHKFGLRLKLHGNGLVVQSLDGKQSIKASSLDRSISKAKLTKRFGFFQPQEASLGQLITPTVKYTSAPLHQNPDRDGLYQQFQSDMEQRQAEMAALRQQEQRLYDFLAKPWGDRYQAIRQMPMLRKHRQEVMKAFKDKRRREFAAFRRTMKQKRDEVAQRYPYTSWSRFLRHQADQGNEAALAVLRSKKDKASPHRDVTAVASPSSPAVSKPALSSVAAMREICRSEGLRTEPQYTIDAKGVIIFKLPGGASLRDTGIEIHYSAHNDLAKRLAVRLAQSRWGQTVVLDGNVLKSSLPMPPPRPQEQGASQGWSR
jgi:hypothetical protein